MDPSTRPRIGIGYRLGKLTVAEPTTERKNGYTVWHCVCDCGGEINLDTRTLQRGTVTDCGCVTKVRPGQNDLTGKRFGKLVCLYPDAVLRSRNGDLMWHCRCDCGNPCIASARQLTKGLRRSCDCLGHPPLKDFVGKRFGKLTVTGYAGKRDGMHQWSCLCDCGKETTVGQTRLQSGKTQSCGCLAKETGAANLGCIEGTSVKMLERSLAHKLSARNTSGYLGVSQERKTGKWLAYITFQGKNHKLGRYDRIEDAIKARARGEEMFEDFLTRYHAQLRESAT